MIIARHLEKSKQILSLQSKMGRGTNLLIASRSADLVVPFEIKYSCFLEHKYNLDWHRIKNCDY